MSRRCPVEGCTSSVPDRFLMCVPHWRSVPRVIKRAWAVTLLQYAARPTREAALATIENRHEVVRIAHAVALGIPA